MRGFRRRKEKGAVLAEAVIAAAFADAAIALTKAAFAFRTASETILKGGSIASAVAVAAAAAPPVARVPSAPAPVPVTTMATAAPNGRAHTPNMNPTIPGGPMLTDCETAVMRVIVSRMPRPTSLSQVAILSGYSFTSSTLHKAVGALRAGNLIEGPGDAMRARAEGTSLVPGTLALPTGAKAVAYWQEKLKSCPAAIFAVFARHYPTEVTSLEDLARECGYSSTSSTFVKGIALLRKLELVEGFRLSHTLMGRD